MEVIYMKNIFYLKIYVIVGVAANNTIQFLIFLVKLNYFM